MGAEGRPEIDFSDVELVEPTLPTAGLDPAPYAILSASQRSNYLDHLRDTHRERAVDSVLGPSWDWKRSSYGNYAATHEHLMKSVVNVRAPVRNGDLVPVDPTPEERDVADSLRHVSTRFVEHQFGERFSVFRGLEFASADLVRGVLEDPSRDAVPIDRITALSNVTTRRTVAREYGLLFVELEIAPDAVALAPDFVLPYVHDGEVRYADAELRVVGDELDRLPVDQCYFPASMVPIVDALEQPATMASEDHEYVKDLLAIAGAGHFSTASDEGRDLLWNWFTHYREQAGYDAREEVFRVHERLLEVLGT